MSMAGDKRQDSNSDGGKICSRIYTGSQNVLEKTGIAGDITGRVIPKQILRGKPIHYGGKNVRKITQSISEKDFYGIGKKILPKVFDINTQTRAGRKQFACLQSACGYIEKILKFAKAADFVLEAGGQVYKGYENIQRDNSSGFAAYSTETIFRAAETAFNYGVHILAPTAIAMLTIGTAKVTIPVLITYLVFSGDIREMVAPIWNDIEENWRPVVQDYFQSWAGDSKDTSGNITIVNVEVEDNMPDRGRNQTSMDMQPEELVESKNDTIPVIIRECNSNYITNKENKFLSGLSDEIPVFSVSSKHIRDMLHKPESLVECLYKESIKK